MPWSPVGNDGLIYHPNCYIELLLSIHYSRAHSLNPIGIYYISASNGKYELGTIHGIMHGTVPNLLEILNCVVYGYGSSQINRGCDTGTTTSSCVVGPIHLDCTY
jgi:hypothetical protein